MLYVLKLPSPNRAISPKISTGRDPALPKIGRLPRNLLYTLDLCELGWMVANYRKYHKVDHLATVNAMTHYVRSKRVRI